MLRWPIFINPTILFIMVSVSDDDSPDINSSLRHNASYLIRPAIQYNIVPIQVDENAH